MERWLGKTERKLLFERRFDTDKDRVTRNWMNKLKREWNIGMQVYCAYPLTYVTVLFS